MYAPQRCSVRTPRSSIVITRRGSRSNPANENRSTRQPTSAEVLKRTSSGSKLDLRDISAKGMTKAAPRCPRPCAFSKSTSPPRRPAAEKKAGPDQKTETSPGAHMRCWMSSLSMARRIRLSTRIGTARRRKHVASRNPGVSDRTSYGAIAPLFTECTKRKKG